MRRSNSRIAQAQGRGEYWMHDLQSLAAACRCARLHVDGSSSVRYLGYNDTVEGRRLFVKESD
ncbi:MAG: hypothetical protein AAGA20_20335 [Planctomycetota bacterium]